MTNCKVGYKDLDESIILLFFWGVYIEVFELFKFIEVIDQFDDCHKRYHNSDTTVNKQLNWEDENAD